MQELIEHLFPIDSQSYAKELLQEFLEKEKEQIKEAYNVGYYVPYENGEDYYKETYDTQTD